VHARFAPLIAKHVEVFHFGKELPNRIDSHFDGFVTVR
jgi:hypothetical protein